MGYPDENGDVVQALEWLKGRGASKLYLVGDSSGATQVVQTLLQLGDMRAHGRPTVPVEVCCSPLLPPLPAVPWPWVPAWGSLEPPRRDGENAQKTGKNGEKMGEIRPKTCEGRELTKDQLAA